MKTMTCIDLGGPCHQKLSAETWKEMVSIMIMHVKKNHPEIVKEMIKMHKDKPKEWSDEMKEKWKKAHEV